MVGLQESLEALPGLEDEKGGTEGRDVWCCLRDHFRSPSTEQMTVKI